MAKVAINGVGRIWRAALSWSDNEWGYANQMIRVRIAKECLDLNPQKLSGQACRRHRLP